MSYISDKLLVKEHFQLIAVYSMNDDLGTDIEKTIKEVDEYIKHSSDKKDKKLNKFLKQFKKAFPQDDIKKSLAAEVLTWALFQQVIALYANGNNIGVIIELHETLEKYSIRDLPRALSDENNKKQIIAKLLERKNLNDIAPFYEKIGIWSKDELEFVIRLNKIRNGIAHKNEELISKALNSGKEIHYLDIWTIAENHDTCEYIIKTIRILTATIKYFAHNKTEDVPTD